MPIANFNKAFFSTAEEKETSKAILIELLEGEKDFWISNGLNEREYIALGELENNEQSKLHPYQSYSTRRSLMSSKVISLKEVQLEIEEWVNKKTNNH